MHYASCLGQLHLVDIPTYRAYLCPCTPCKTAGSSCRSCDALAQQAGQILRFWTKPRLQSYMLAKLQLDTCKMLGHCFVDLRPHLCQVANPQHYVEGGERPSSCAAAFLQIHGLAIVLSIQTKFCITTGALQVSEEQLACIPILIHQRSWAALTSMTLLVKPGNGCTVWRQVGTRHSAGPALTSGPSHPTSSHHWPCPWPQPQNPE